MCFRSYQRNRAFAPLRTMKPTPRPNGPSPHMHGDDFEWPSRCLSGTLRLMWMWHLPVASPSKCPTKNKTNIDKNSSSQIEGTVKDIVTKYYMTHIRNIRYWIWFVYVEKNSADELSIICESASLSSNIGSEKRLISECFRVSCHGLCQFSTSWECRQAQTMIMRQE